MAERTQFTIPEKLSIIPSDLLRANIQVPMVEDCIPIRMPRYGFTGRAVPIITALGEGAIAVSLGRPFGVVEYVNFWQPDQEFQKVAEITVAPRFTTQTFGLERSRHLSHPAQMILDSLAKASLFMRYTQLRPSTHSLCSSAH